MINTMTKPNAFLTTSHQTLSPGDYVTFAICLASGICHAPKIFEYLCVFRRTTWAEEKKLNMETFGVPGRFLRGRGFRGRGQRGQSTNEQRPLPKVGSGRL